MPPSYHSKKRSPSKAFTWLACSLSTLLNQGDDGFDSEAAIFGSECHELGQRLLEKALNITNYDEEPVSIEELKKKLTHYNEDMQLIADGYCEAVVNLFDYYKRKTGEDPLIYLETFLPMDFEEGEKDGGTLDMGLYTSDDGGTIVIEDLKTGRKPVNAYDYDNHHINPQLGLYAIYFYEDIIKGLYPVKNVKLIIHQPVINNINEYSLSLDELLKFKEEVIMPAVERMKVKNLEANPGSHCCYCAGRHICASYNKSNLSIGEEITKPIEQFTDEEIEAILPRLDAFIKYADDLKNYAIEKARSGHKWNGYKLVPSKVSRKISDEDKVKKILESQGISPLNPGKLLGITEIEKKLGKLRFKELISPYVIWQESAPILVPESDPRQGIVIANKEDK